MRGSLPSGGRRRRAGAYEAEKTAQPLGEALEMFFKSSGLQLMMKYPELHEVWDRVVGADIAGHTRVSKFQRGVLEIAVDSSALLTEIQFHRAALLQDLRREVRKPFIANLFFVHRPMQDDDDERRKTDA